MASPRSGGCASDLIRSISRPCLRRTVRLSIAGPRTPGVRAVSACSCTAFPSRSRLDSFMASRRSLSAPTHSLWVFLAWWFTISLVATAVVSLVFALTRGCCRWVRFSSFRSSFPTRRRLGFSSRFVPAPSNRSRSGRGSCARPRRRRSAQQAAEILLRLVAQLSYHDHITAGHAERVRAYSYALGKQLGPSGDELDRLNWAALLHDIGKLEVSRRSSTSRARPPTRNGRACERIRSTARRSSPPLPVARGVARCRRVSPRAVGRHRVSPWTRRQRDPPAQAASWRSPTSST